MSTWNPDLYLQFATERTQPSIDLVGRIQVANPTRIVDLGCGPGNSTAILRQRWPNAEAIGLDRSAEMIAAASKTYPSARWLLADISTWTADTPFDIAFSNATLHWLPDHAWLFPHLLAQVAPDGAFAVQIPARDLSPLRQVILEVASDPQWDRRMDKARQAQTREKPSFYYDVLQPIASRIDIWETEYYHVMDSPKAIVNWCRGSGLRPFLAALESEAEKLRFEQLILEGYTKAYPCQKDGRILFPFRRLFVIAYR
ncbi:methyltransferase domain-containing protein [Pseudanabaena sp. PCC 6802]|uniref:methyltransferase domain-containing protein n=1 Tax=Pseudanabaena sp. PCC 6802 TaxID=118173 RepID=UPI00034B0D2F|nr:methyltransferase domain-containing protein [Pseudanabaena sp. PCC 6802]